MRFPSVFYALCIFFVTQSTYALGETTFRFAEVTEAGESFRDHSIYRMNRTQTALYAETDETTVLQLEYFKDQQLLASVQFQLTENMLLRLPSSVDHFDFSEDGVHTLVVTEFEKEIFNASVVIREEDIVQPLPSDANLVTNDEIDAGPSYQLDRKTGRTVSINRTAFPVLRYIGSEIYDRIAPSVTLITTPNSMGSGVAIDEAGLILTNYHVIEGEDVVTVRYKPETIFQDISIESYIADVVYRDPITDLALIKLRYAPGNIRPVELGSRRDIRVGADVHAIGHPLGNVWTYTRGYISQYRPQHNWATEVSSNHLADVIQTQTPINPGNSGGPLLSNEGLLLGINTFIDADPSNQGLNFAVSLTSVEDFLQRFAASNAQTAAAFIQKNPVRIFDQNGDGRIDYKLYDDDQNDVYERTDADLDFDGWFDVILYDDNQNARWDLIVDLVQGPPQFAVYRFDYNEDEIVDEVGYDYDMDGAIDAFD